MTLFPQLFLFEQIKINKFKIIISNHFTLTVTRFVFHSKETAIFTRLEPELFGRARYCILLTFRFLITAKSFFLLFDCFVGIRNVIDVIEYHYFHQLNTYYYTCINVFREILSYNNVIPSILKLYLPSILDFVLIFFCLSKKFT